MHVTIPLTPTPYFFNCNFSGLLGTMQVKSSNISPGKDEEEMTTNNMDLELTSLTLQLLTLAQDLVNAKLKMEDNAKVRGFL